MPQFTPEQQARSDEFAARVEADRRARHPEFYGGGRGSDPGAPDWQSYDLPSTEDRPVFDESKVQSLAQQHAAPGIRTLREAYQTAASRLPSNPKSRLTLRDALKGYGSGLENVMGGARKTARAEEMAKFQTESAAYQQEYSARLAQAQYQANLENQRMAQQWQADYAQFLEDPEGEDPLDPMAGYGGTHGGYYQALLG